MASPGLNNLDALINQRVEELANGTPQADVEPKRGNWFTSGVSAGVDQLQALSGRGIQAVGDAVGFKPISDVGAGIAERNFKEAAANGRPDLESRPSLENWTDYPAWAGYQAAKQLPTLAAAVVAARLGGSRFAPAVPGAAAEIGAVVPRVLGGGGLRAGATAAEAEVAQQAGARWVAGMASQAPVMYPQAVGSMYDEALQAGEGGQRNAVKSLAFGVPYSLMESLEPGALSSIVKKGLTGNILKRAGTGAAVNAATETITEGVQTGMEQSFRPDLTPREKMASTVEGAITGGGGGGLFGARAGVLGGNPVAKSTPPAKVTTPDIKKTVDEALGIEPAGQTVMPGMEARARPAGSPAVTRGEEPAPDFTSNARVDLTNFPVGGGQGPFRSETGFNTPPEAEARQGIEERRVYPYNTPGTARWERYTDVGGPLGYEVAQRAAAEMPDVKADTSRNTQDRMSDLFANQSIPLEEQLSPAEIARRTQESTPVYSPEEQAARTKTVDDFFGKATGGWVEKAKTSGWKDETDLVASVITTISEYDAANEGKGRAIPAGLKKVAERVGLTKADGAPRDLEAEYRVVAAENADKAQRAIATGTAQAKAAYEAHTKDKFAPLKLQLETLRAAQARLVKAQPAEATQEAATAPSPATLLDIKGNPTTASEAALALRAAPPVTPAPSFEQRFRGAGAPNTNLNEAEVVPAAPVVTPPSKVADMAQVGQRWAQGKVGQTQAERVAAREAVANAPAAVAPVIPATPLAQGSRFTPGAETAPIAEPTKFVTAQDVAKAKRSRTRKPAAVPVLPNAPLAGGTSFAAEAPVAPTPATDIAPNETRDQLVKQLQRAKLERIANTDDVGRPMRAAASEALAGLDAFQPGADATAARVLAEYAVLTGDTVFSRRDPNNAAPPMSDQDFDQALIAATRQLPRSALQSIQVVSTKDALPAEVQAAAERMGVHPSEIDGVLHDGVAYIVQAHISSQRQLESVIAHEIFGHGGARALYGDRRIPILSTAFKLAGGVEGLRAIARRFGVEGQLNKYIPERELTDADKAAIVDEMLAQAAGKTDGKFRTALLAWVGTFKSMLIRALRAAGMNQFAQRLDTFDAATFAATLAQMRYAVEMGGNLNGGDTAFSRAAVPSTPEGMNESSKNFMSTVDNVENWFHSRDYSQMSLAANKLNLYTSTVGHIVDSFAPLFDQKKTNADGTVTITNPLRDWQEANRARGVTEQRIAHLVQVGYRMFERVVRDDAPGAKKIGQLMAYTGYEIDPAKTWEEQPWLHGSKNAEGLKEHVKAANKLYRDVRQNHTEAGNTYDAFRHTNEAMHYAQQAVSLYNMLAMDPAVAEETKENFTNPMDAFLAAQGDYDNPRAARDFWKAQTDAMVPAVEKYIEGQRGLSALSDPATAKKIAASTSSLAARVKSIKGEQEAMAQAPYFHLGRFGDYVLSFHVKRGENGADPAAMDRVVTAFRDAGIEGIELPTHSTRSNAFIRFENKTQMDEARRVAEALAKEGVVLHEFSGTEEGEGDKRIKTYSRDGETSSMAFELSKSPEWARDLMDRIRAEQFGNYKGISEDSKKVADAMSAEFERFVTQYFLNLLPDTAVSKVMVHRNNVPGFSSDMIRSHLFRAQVGGRALANLYAAAKISKARQGMHTVANEARSDSDTTQAMLKQNVVSEIFKRDAQRPLLDKNNFIDTWRAANHAYFLGMSPSYAVVNMTQIGVLLWPELAKRFGFINSAKAIGKVTPTAMKIMKAVIAEGGKLGWNNLPDASINREVLSRPELKLTQPQIDFIMRVVNSGLIDIGSQSRELGRVVEGTTNSKTETALRWASALGYYSEMTSRLVAALSARELHGGYSPEMHKYVDETVRQSMLQYETWNQSRATGKMGLAGQMTPVMTSFMQYTFQLTEKLYRELGTAFWTAGKTQGERVASRKFLAAHLAAVTTLAGSLGLPMASVFAKAFDTLSDFFGDDEEPSNIKAAYRDWLEFNLGKDVAEVVSRGVPRAMGYDISQRVGEQDILPFAHMASKLITDRGKWQDRAERWALQTMGSPVSMISNLVNGGGKIMEGDGMAGMIDIVPNAIKGPLKAYKLSTRGYVDSKGNAQPMDASTWEVLTQAMGFNPARKAEYAEMQGTQAARKGEMYRKTSLIRNEIARAIESGDAEAAREALLKAQRFDQNNPDFPVLPTISAVLASRARERAKARALGAPLGTSPEMADVTGFGNLD